MFQRHKDKPITLAVAATKTAKARLAPRPAMELVPVETVTSILTGLNLLTSEQIQTLVGLVTANGIPFLSVDDRVTLYEVVCECLYNFDACVARIQHVTSSRSAIFASPQFDTEAAQAIADAAKLSGSETIIRKGWACVNPQCKSTNTSSVDVQLRSGDEGMNTTSVCFDCGRKWTI